MWPQNSQCRQGLPTFAATIYSCLPDLCKASLLYVRWDAETSSLICDVLGVAYPVTNGMPNLRPADGHVIEAQDRQSSTSQQPWGDAEPTPQ